jgi:drug/metabolite transporter (DMT)-like permease
VPRLSLPKDAVNSPASNTPSNTSLPETLRGLAAACLSPMFLGMAPVLGKIAISSGSDPFTVAATRTVVAAAILWVVYLIFFRKYIYIFPAGLLGCVVVGSVNGIGSLFYYNGLSALDASVAQLLNATYLIFVIILARLNGQKLTARTIFRTFLAMFAVLLLTGGISGRISWLGVAYMLGNAIMFAGTIILSQRVLYEMPSPTATLYIVTTMAVVVVMARVVYRLEWIPQSTDAIGAIVALGVTTALSRLTLFIGVKNLGGLQTVLLAFLETGVSLVLGYLLLNDQLNALQWVGVAIFGGSVLLIRPDELKRAKSGKMPVLNMAGMAFQSVAFTQAFGKEHQRMSPEELEAIRRMLEAPPSSPQK